MLVLIHGFTSLVRCIGHGACIGNRWVFLHTVSF